MPAHGSQKCQKDLQFDRFLEAIGHARDNGLQQKFDETFRRLMRRRSDAGPLQQNAIRTWPTGAHVPLEVTNQKIR